MSVFQSLIDVYNNRGACYVILIDPDNKNDENHYHAAQNSGNFSQSTLGVAGDGAEVEYIEDGQMPGGLMPPQTEILPEALADEMPQR